MKTLDDDFPYTSDDPSLASVEEENIDSSLTTQQLSDLKATLRLLVGSALSGSDVFTQRLRQMQAAQEPVEPEAIGIIDEDETYRDLIKYLLLGILFETPDVIQRSLETVDSVSTKVYNLFSRMLSPFTNSWIFSPVKDRFDYAAAHGEKLVDRLIMKGRLEEQNSRLLLQQKNIDDLINEFMEYVVLKTEVRRIIQEEGVSISGDVVDEFREQSAAVDSLLEQRLKSIFRKRVPPQPDTPPSHPAEGG